MSPLVVREHRILGGRAHRAVPNPAGRQRAEFGGPQPGVLVEPGGEPADGGARVTAGIGRTGPVPGRDKVRVLVLLPSARAEEVGQQWPGAVAGGHVGYHAASSTASRTA